MSRRPSNGEVETWPGGNVCACYLVPAPYLPPPELRAGIFKQLASLLVHGRYEPPKEVGWSSLQASECCFECNSTAAHAPWGAEKQGMELGPPWSPLLRARCDRSLL
jgi:hypothetical protein